MVSVRSGSIVQTLREESIFLTVYCLPVMPAAVGRVMVTAPALASQAKILSEAVTV
jgi:hypothetical protein